MVTSDYILVPKSGKKKKSLTEGSIPTYESLRQAVETKRENLMRDALRELGSSEMPYATPEIKLFEGRFILAQLAGKIVGYDNDLQGVSCEQLYSNALAKQMAGGPDNDWHKHKPKADEIMRELRSFINPTPKENTRSFGYLLSIVEEARQALIGPDPEKNTEWIIKVRMAEIPYLLGKLADQAVPRDPKAGREEQKNYIDALAGRMAEIVHTRMAEVTHNREEKGHSAGDYHIRAEASVFREIDRAVEIALASGKKRSR